MVAGSSGRRRSRAEIARDICARNHRITATESPLEQGPWDLECSWFQAAEIALYGVISRRTSSPCEQCSDSRNERWVLADLNVDCRRLRIGFVFCACPDGHVVSCCVAGSDPEEGDVGIGARRFEHVARDEHQSYDPK